MRWAIAGLCALLMACGTARVPSLDFQQTRESITGRQSSTVIVAHRANGFGGPENSLDAIERCIRNGVTSIEIDIRYTRDAVPVLLHDETLNRTTTRTGAVGSQEYDPEMRLANGEPLPTLEETLSRYSGRAMFYLDMKEQDLSPAVAAVERASGMHSVYFLLKNEEHYLQARELLKRHPEMIVMPRIKNKEQLEMVDRLLEYRIAKVNERLPRDVVDELRRRGVVLSANMILPWEWNNLSSYAANGVNVVQTDRPGKYLRAPAHPSHARSHQRP